MTFLKKQIHYNIGFSIWLDIFNWVIKNINNASKLIKQLGGMNLAWSDSNGRILEKVKFTPQNN